MTTFAGQPLKMKGTFIGSVGLIAMTRSLAGVFTTDATVSGDLHTSVSLKDFQYRVMNNSVDQSPSDQFLEDMVSESGSYECTIVEQRLALYVPLTEQLAFGGYSYCRVQRNYLPPGATVPMIFIAILHIKEFDGGSTEKGINECTLTLDSAGVPPYVTAVTGSLPF